MMDLSLPNEPFIVPRYKTQNGGVDFLGLRQTNLDMMAGCLPGMNNVTNFIRPFSVISWMFWKFHALAEEAGVSQPKYSQLRDFTERAEILFTWGHVLKGIGGVPGTRAKPPTGRSGKVSLGFSDWKRDRRNTSLMAAVQYGPASKAVSGLGLVEPLEGGFFRTYGHGVELAEALESRLGGAARGILERLDTSSGSERDALNLMQAWRLDGVTAAERRAFRAVFFDEAQIATGDALIARRSATLKLIITVLAKSRGILSEDGIRKAMVRMSVNGRRIDLETALRPVWARWITLQLRQLQRFAFEAMLSWVERNLIGAGFRDVTAMIDVALKADGAGSLWQRFQSPEQAKEYFGRRLPDLATLLDKMGHSQLGLFGLRDALVSALDDADDLSVLNCAVCSLLYCARATELLVLDEICKVESRRGGADRISLSFWKQTTDRLSSADWREFLSFVLETLVLSQHFAVAAGRYDGGTQRLRITIEEQGLEALVPEPLHPLISRDRLRTALSLMLDTQMIGGDRQNDQYSAHR